MNSRLKSTFSVWNFRSRLKTAFLGLFFSCGQKGARNSKQFLIENFIPHWKLDFFNIASQVCFEILGPSGYCHFTVVATRGRYKILQNSSFHSCQLAIVIVWRSLQVPQLPLNDGQVVLRTLRKARFGKGGGLRGTKIVNKQLVNK